MRRALEALTVAALYWVTGKLGLLWALPPGVATAVWPPSGLALAAVLAWGPAVWPGILVGSLLVNAPTLFDLASPWRSAAVLLAIAAGSTAQALLGAAWLRRVLGGPDPFSHALDMFHFAGIEAASCLIACTVGASALVLGGFAPGSEFAANWWTWWLGDLAGVLIVAPLWLAWERGGRPPEGGYQFEAAGILAALLAPGWLVFGPRSLGATHEPIVFLFLPPVVWAAYRFGPRGAVVSTLTLSAVALSGTSSGYGPFAKPGGHESLLMLQSYLGLISLTSLVLAAAMEERRRVETELELLVRERTRSLREELILRVKGESEIRRLNRELEAFSHTAAHDLRAPLRSMAGYAQLVLDGFRDKLDEKGRRQLERIVASAERLSRLVDDLLGLSMASKKPLKRETVDLSGLADAIAAELAQAEPRRKASVSIAPGLIVPGDAGLLRLALQNLLANAWKFSSQKEDALVEFGAELRDGRRVYFVKDNGTGFDPAGAADLFTPFVRLHNSSKYPGTGIGLATVRRIVERHGGRVWAEAEPGEGAAFYFTLEP